MPSPRFVVAASPMPGTIPPGCMSAAGDASVLGEGEVRGGEAGGRGREGLGWEWVGGQGFGWGCGMHRFMTPQFVRPSRVVLQKKGLLFYRKCT